MRYSRKKKKRKKILKFPSNLKKKKPQINKPLFFCLSFLKILNHLKVLPILKCSVEKAGNEESNFVTYMKIKRKKKNHVFVHLLVKCNEKSAGYDVYIFTKDSR